ncbi:MAG TPA: ABC transporter permease [Phycisphaerae bacterium]|nr:ABC transporter permease [Phycisphaerae bacterium]
MRKVVAVAVREFIETVKTKAFLVSALVMPLLVGGAVSGFGWISRSITAGELPPRRIAVVDYSGVVFGELARQCEAYNREHPRRQLLVAATAAADADTLAKTVREGEWHAYLIVPADVVDADTACEFGRKDIQFETGVQLQNMVNEAVFTARCRRTDPPIDPESVRELQRSAAIRTIDVQTGEEAGDEAARMVTPFVFMFLLFMATLGISNGLLTTVIEEKSSRVVEVLLSAISPLQLMAGKILGMAAVGLAMLSVWGGVGYASAHASGAGHLVTGYRVTYALLYFLPGFLLLSSLLAGIGSACNTIKDAQGMAFPLSLITIVPMFCWMYISQSPASTVSVALSFIPPMTPFVMILRVCADPHTPIWQIVASLALLWASVVVAMWASAKIFRVGVLMYGKPPSPRELFHWLRHA